MSVYRCILFWYFDHIEVSFAFEPLVLCLYGGGVLKHEFGGVGDWEGSGKSSEMEKNTIKISGT